MLTARADPDGRYLPPRRTVCVRLYYTALHRYTLSDMFRVPSSWSWWHEPRDERELIRLDVVGLAAEVATVARHIEDGLPPAGAYRGADQIRAKCHSYVHMALLVLSADNSFEEISGTDLLEALDVFRDLQRKVVRLRDEAERLGDSLLPV